MAASTPPASYRPLDISSGVRANARRLKTKTALRLGEQRVSYGELGARANRVSHLAKHCGLVAGQNAAIVAANVIEYFEIVCGISALGAAIATVNPRQTPAELAAILSDCQARLVFVDQANEEAVRAALPMPAETRVITIGSDYDTLLAQASDTDPGATPQEWDTFAIPYTSGTTGQPKGVCLSHRSRVIGFFAHASVYGCFSSADTFLVTTGLFHGGGFAFPMGTLYLGGEVELMPPFQPDLLLEFFHSGRHSGTFLVPTQLNAMLGLEQKLLARCRGHGLKAMICNAAPLAEDTKLRSLDYFGEGVLHETYGSTEAGVVSNLEPADMRRKQNCVGRPIACQSVKLLDDQRREVAPGEIGELFGDGPTLFNGYYNRADDTAAGFHNGGFSAGDLARIDDEGYLYIVDRAKDMIISGGVNIYPRDIEETLFRHPQIVEAVAVGVADAYWGEAVCAFVVVKSGEPIDEQHLINYCREQLAAHKVPKSVRFIDVVPRNAAGKVLRKDLRAVAR